MSTRVEIALRALRVVTDKMRTDYSKEIFLPSSGTDGDEDRRLVAIKMELLEDFVSQLQIALKEEDL